MTGVPASSHGGGTPSGAAGGDLAGTYPNPTLAAGAVVNADVNAAAAIAYSKLALTASIVKGDLTAAALLALPGAELDYAQYTAAVSVTATTEGTANTIVTGASVAYDGATAVLIQFYCPIMTSSDDTLIRFVLLEDATVVGWLAGPALDPITLGADRTLPVVGFHRRTPSAASHTYAVKAFLSVAATVTVSGGVGGSGNFVPGFLRVTRVA